MMLCLRVLLLLGLLIGASNAASTVDEVLQIAEKATGEGLPDIAILQLRKALRENLPEADQARLRVALAEALVATNEGALALVELDGIPEDPRVSLARARAFALNGNWARAEEDFLKAAKDPTREVEAKFYAAEAARVNNGWARALPIYQSLVEDSVWKEPARRRLAVYAIEQDDLDEAEDLLEKKGPEDREGAVLLARLLVAREDYDGALREVESVAKDTKGLSPELATVAIASYAQALKNLKRTEEAAKSLQQFVEQYPQNPYLGNVIREMVVLDKSAAQESLIRWAGEPPAARRALAAFALAKLRYETGKWSEAAQGLREFTVEPLLSSAQSGEGLRLLLTLQMASSEWDSAVGTLDLLVKRASGPEKVELAQTKADIALERGKYAEAGAIYRALAELPEISEEQKLYFRTLAALWNGEEEAFSKSYQEFSERYPTSSSRSGLLLERGLFFAQTKDPRGKEALTRFVEEFPSDSRLDEARVALAELAFLSFPRDLADAGRWLEKVKTESEKADYLRLWIYSATPGADAAMLALSKKMVDRWPRSPKRPYVLFKLGESYFGKDDYANAQAAFEQLATEFPSHELTGRANYLAGVAMLRTMNTEALDKAILTLERAAQGDPAVRNVARLAQAEAYVKGGREGEALVVYEDILKSNPDHGTRAAALCGKGEMLLAQGKERIPAATEAFDTVANDAQIDRYWKQEALWRKAKALEMAGDLDGALLGFYDAVKFGDEIKDHPGGELFWYFKSGFDAARLLEMRERWPAAIAMYQKLAALSGTRSVEAAERAKRLQLEHYIWDDSRQ